MVPFTRRLLQTIQGFCNLHTILFLPLTIKPSSYYIYISSKIFPFKKENLRSIWCTSRSSMVTIVSTNQIDFICIIKENVSLKSIPSIYVNPLATKFALCLTREPLTLYLILKIHLQFIGLQSNGKKVSIRVLLSCENWNLESMAFFQCCESSPFKASTKEWGSSTST